MRITLAQTLIMAVFSTLVSADALRGQGIMDRKVSINVRNAEMKSILMEIEKQTSVVFTYRANLIKGLKNVSFSTSDGRLGDVLAELLSPNVIVLALDDEEEIILKPNAETRHARNISVAENLVAVVTGVVTDEAGQPVPGVNVLQKGTTNGTTTDADGR